MDGWTDRCLLLFYFFTVDDRKHCRRKSVPRNLKDKMSQTFGTITARSAYGSALGRQDLLCCYDQQLELPALEDGKGKIPDSYTSQNHVGNYVNIFQFGLGKKSDSRGQHAGELVMSP